MKVLESWPERPLPEDLRKPVIFLTPAQLKRLKRIKYRRSLPKVRRLKQEWRDGFAHRLSHLIDDSDLEQRLLDELLD